jgi:hypothetical protein
MMIYTKSLKSKKHKVPKAQKEQHDAWLKSIATMSSGINSNRISKVSNKSNLYVPPKSVPPGRETPHYPSLNTGFTGTLSKVGIMNDYYKMSKEDQAKVDEVNSCVAPMHKSNYIYVSAGINPAGLGRKNEVL